MKKILIVEDDEDVLECFKMTIECQDYVILTARDGVEAWYILNSTQVDVLVTDYLMPNMDGAKLSSLAHKHFPTIPILMISTFTPKDMVVQNIIQCFIAKPFHLEILKQEIDRLLS